MSDDENNAYNACPTCGTRTYAHPDRQVGEDALDVPDEVMQRGISVLRRYFVVNDEDTLRETVVAIFKAMARDA